MTLATVGISFPNSAVALDEQIDTNTNSIWEESHETCIGSTRSRTRTGDLFGADNL